MASNIECLVCFIVLVLNIVLGVHVPPPPPQFFRGTANDRYLLIITTILMLVIFLFVRKITPLLLMQRREVVEYLIARPQKWYQLDPDHVRIVSFCIGVFFALLSGVLFTTYFEIDFK